MDLSEIILVLLGITYVLYNILLSFPLVQRVMDIREPSRELFTLLTIRYCPVFNHVQHYSLCYHM